MLTANTNLPVVPQTTVQTTTLHALQIFTQCLVQEICKLLASFAILNVAVPVKHPSWNFELLRIVDDSDNLIDFIGCELTGTLVQINVAFLTNDVRKPSANAFHCGQCEHHFLAQGLRRNKSQVV